MSKTYKKNFYKKNITKRNIKSLEICPIGLKSFEEEFSKNIT